MRLSIGGFHGDFGSWIERLPTREGKPFVVAYAHSTLSVELFAPRGVDTQTPHRRDEVYVNWKHLARQSLAARRVRRAADGEEAPERMQRVSWQEIVYD
jgi:hypothetical protein